MALIFRDTTPDLVFEIPFDTSLITDAGVTISQHGEEALVKPLGVLSLDGNKVTASLTRAETRKLRAGAAAEVQLWVLKGEDSYQSEIFRLPVKKILRVWDEEPPEPEGGISVVLAMEGSNGNSGVMIDGEGYEEVNLPAVINRPAMAKSMTVATITESGLAPAQIKINGEVQTPIRTFSTDGLVLEFLPSDEPILKNGDTITVTPQPDAPRLGLFLKIKNSLEIPLPLGLAAVHPGETKLVQSFGTGGYALVFLPTLSIKTLYLYVGAEHVDTAPVRFWSITHEDGGTDEIAVAQIYIPDMTPDDVLEISATPPS